MANLVSAVENENVDEVRQLLYENKERIYEMDEQHDTPILKACKYCYKNVEKYTEIVKILLENGAKLDDSGDQIGQSPLILAAHAGCKDIVDILIQAGANIHHRNQMGENAIITSTQEGHIDVVKTLLKAGADVNISNADGETPLMLAQKYLRGDKQTKMVDLLSKKNGGKKNKSKKNKSKKQRKSRRNLKRKSLKN
jgi:ankyrin repeat protein